MVYIVRYVGCSCLGKLRDLSCFYFKKKKNESKLLRNTKRKKGILISVFFSLNF